MPIPDGVVLMYVKDGTVYPVALTKEQSEMLPVAMQILCGPQSLKVLIDYPVGEAIRFEEAEAQKLQGLR